MHDFQHGKSAQLSDASGAADSAHISRHVIRQLSLADVRPRSAESQDSLVVFRAITSTLPPLQCLPKRMPDRKPLEPNSGQNFLRFYMMSNVASVHSE